MSEEKKHILKSGITRYESLCDVCMTISQFYFPSALYEFVGEVCESCESASYIVCNITHTKNAWWSRIFDNFQDAYDYWAHSPQTRKIGKYQDLELKP